MINILRALANETRMEIMLKLYRRTDDDNVPMQEIRDELGISKANLSQHLDVLKRVNAVIVTPTGRTSLVAINEKNEAIIEMMETIDRWI